MTRIVMSNEIVQILSYDDSGSELSMLIDITPFLPYCMGVKALYRSGALDGSRYCLYDARAR